MGQNTKIEWCHHTFNPHRGCAKVSQGCENCYAWRGSLRNPGVLGVWGPNGKRVVASEATWRDPLKWNHAAKKAGERHRVFCASLADVFESWDGPMLDSHGRQLFTCPWSNTWGYTSSCADPLTMDHVRYRFLNLIMETPNLDWLLLTKRPENIEPTLRRMPVLNRDNVWDHLWPKHYPNVWIGTSVENQVTANERIPHLLRIPATVRFLSIEPLLGPIELSDSSHWKGKPFWLGKKLSDLLDWVIVGGESGPNARPMHPDWARSLRDQCVKAGVPFHFKQFGAWAPIDQPWEQLNPKGLADNERWLNFAGGHGYHGDAVWRMRRVGKKAAGRLLDGRTWDQFPMLGARVRQNG